jgi:hypothetical protein
VGSGSSEVCRQQGNEEPRFTKLCGPCDDPGKQQAEEWEYGELWPEYGEFVVVDIVEAGHCEKSGSSGAADAGGCEGNAEEAEGGEEGGGELESGDSGGLFDGGEGNFGEPWQVDHADAFADGEEWFCAGD